MAKQETENSEDTGYIRQVEQASTTMASSVPPMVESAKSLAKNITHPGLVADWRKNNTLVSGTFFVSYYWVTRRINIIQLYIARFGFYIQID